MYCRSWTANVAVMKAGSKEIEDLRRESEQLRNALAYSKSEFERRKNEMLRKAREQADEIYRRSAVNPKQC